MTYNHYLQFAEWTKEGINFVCRLQDNARPSFREVLFDEPLAKDAAYLLLQVIQTQSDSNKAFSTIVALLRIHLIAGTAILMGGCVFESKKPRL